MLLERKRAERAEEAGDGESAVTLLGLGGTEKEREKKREKRIGGEGRGEEGREEKRKRRG